MVSGTSGYTGQKGSGDSLREKSDALNFCRFSESGPQHCDGARLVKDVGAHACRWGEGGILAAELAGVEQTLLSDQAGFFGADQLSFLKRVMDIPLAFNGNDVMAKRAVRLGGWGLSTEVRWAVKTLGTG